jgi:hypothetical protein
MKSKCKYAATVALVVAVMMTLSPVRADAKEEAKIPAGSKVFIAPMGGFENDLRAAFVAKQVPLTIVEKREDADFEISGAADTQKASTAKKILLGSWHSREEASISVADLKTGVIVYAYSYHNDNSAHGRKSSAESCAKHLKDQIKKP